MEKKIIELSDAVNSDYHCLICGAKTVSTKMKINRLMNGDSLINFYVCNDCIARMQDEIQTYNEVNMG